MKKNLRMFLLITLSILLLGGCYTKHSHSDHDHHHDESGELPPDIKAAQHPTLQVGDKAIIYATHMEGMDGSVATIVGAYDTIAYTISYTPTNGGEKVKNHKWIVHEEIEDPSDQPYKRGDQVVVEAEHMAGMHGVTATIDSAEETTVYMIDYTSTTGKKVINHKWVTEEELVPQDVLL